MARLDDLAKRAALASRWQFLPFHEKNELAWSAIAEELYSCQDPPRAHDLIRVAEKAIRRHVDDIGRMRGVYYYRPDAPYMARFEKYWWSQAAPVPSPEDRVIDRTAFRQIWPRLTGRHQMVLAALAAHGDYERAAASLNKSHRTFVTQIYLARKQFFELWHEGEQPSKMWGRDNTRGRNQRSVTARTIRRRRARRAASGAEQQHDARDDGMSTPAT